MTQYTTGRSGRNRAMVILAPMSIALTTIALAVTTLAGCATGARIRQPGQLPGVADAGQAMSDAERADLKQRALALLEQAAVDPNPQARANAIEALQSAPEALTQIVRSALADDNVAVRFAAAMSAGRRKLVDSAPWIEPLTADESPVVRAAAVYALRQLNREVNPTPLAQLLTTSPDPRRRAMAAFILGELRDPSAIPLLKDAARRSLPRARVIGMRLLRLQIAEALVKLGDEGAVETIRAALYPSRPEDLEATALAVQIIGEVGDRRAVDQLIYLMAQTGPDRPPAEVRLAAAAALAKLGLRNGGFLADELARDHNPAIRAQCAAVYGETGGDAALRSLASMLDDPSLLVRIAVASSILKALTPQRRDRFAVQANR